jgi:hypothetical protein
MVAFKQRALAETGGCYEHPAAEDCKRGVGHRPQSESRLVCFSFFGKCQPLGPASVSGIDEPAEDQPTLGNFLPLRRRVATKILQQLDEKVATGPDKLPAKIWKRCAQALAVPVVLVARLCLSTGKWPDEWRFHWVVPLFKKGAKHDPAKYRGIHLTSVFSKAVERVIGSVLVPFLQRVSGFGDNQWAYQIGRSSNDLLALLATTWLSAFESHGKIGAFLSDISGAFDRVPTARLIRKLIRSGVGAKMAAFLADYLAPRIAGVAVNGVMSDLSVLSNMVFQGTVLGPPLWNVFFADVADAVRISGSSESVFADDLNAFRVFDTTVPNADVKEAMSDCQQEVHAWGSANGVAFDPSKEAFMVIHPTYGEGESFKLLGTMFDSKLIMDEAVSAIIRKAGPKLTALLRTKPYYATGDMMQSYKSHILCLLEGSTGAIYHASNTVLHRLDHLQDKFLRELGMSAEQAFLDFNLAPLQLRRDIAMLGLVFKCGRGDAHPKLSALFPASRTALHRYATRVAEARHSNQLHDFASNCRLASVQRSLLGLVKVYNLLPQVIVDSKSVSSFQSMLTNLARNLCRARSPHWFDRFSPRSSLHVHLLS